MLVVKALDSYGEPYKRIIMEIVREHECLSYEIINKSGVPQASTYRRINELIENGFITEIKDDNPKLLGRHPSKYRSVVEKIDIFVGKEESVKFKFFDDHLEKSKIVGFLKESNSSISILN